MKRFENLLRYIIGVALGIIFAMLLYTYTQPEYEVELIDQDTVKIRSNLSGNIYYVTPDKVNDVFEIDNL